MIKNESLRLLIFSEGCIRATNLDQEVTWRCRHMPHSINMAVAFSDLDKAIKSARPKDVIEIAQGDEGFAVVRFGVTCLNLAIHSPALIPPPTTGSMIGSGVVLDDLQEHLQTCAVFGSSDETRYVLNGVFMDNEGSYVATDGRRLIKIMSSPLLNLPEPVIIPLPAINLLSAKPLQERPAEITVHSRFKGSPDPVFVKIVLGDGDWTVTTKVVEGRYPNYRQVIPKSDGLLASFDEATAGEIINFLRPIGNDAIIVKIVGSKDTVEFSTVPKTGNTPKTDKKVKTTVPKTKSSAIFHATVSFDREIRASFNAEYFLDALKAGCRRIRIKDELHPLIADGPSRMAVVMPLRVQ